MLCADIAQFANRVGLVSDELMLDVVKSELDRLRGEVRLLHAQGQRLRRVRAGS